MLTTTQFIIAAFALLLGALLLPLSYGVRTALFLLLIGLVIMTLIGGGMQFLTSIFY